jgi:signal transduction histidine kinase
VRRDEGNARVLATAGRYALAVGIAAAALWTTSALLPVLGAPFFFFAFPAALLAALAGGTGPGLACVATHAAGAIWFFAEPYGSLAVSNPRAALRLALVAASAAFVAAVGGRLRTALQRERRLRAEAQGEAAARAIAEEALREAHDRLSALQTLTAELSAARTSDELAAAVFRRGLPLLGARSGSISFPAAHGALAVRSSEAPAEDAASGSGLAPLDGPHPAAEVARTGRALWLGNPGEIEARFPALAQSLARSGHQACACVPLRLDGEPVGVLGLGFSEPRAFDLRERSFIGSVAQLCAQAFSRARRHEAEERARARAEAAEEEARRAVIFRDQVLAVVGHDLRTPLSAITMAVALARQRAAGDDRTEGALDRIARSARRMVEIIRDLLDVARARQGLGLALTRAPVSAREVCAQAVGELEQVFPDRAIRMRAADDARISADASRLHQAISNLVGNALQHGDPGAAVTIEVAADEDAVAIRVANEGEPIPQERLAEIFEPFRRGGAAGAGDGGSLGLGLYIVREIARAHGGAVTVTSDAADGTVFELRLPRAPAAGDEPVTSSRR